MSRVHRASVGNVELVALQDTWLRPKLTDFFPEAAGASLEPYRDLLSDADELTVSITPWLIRSAGRTILVDTGMGGRPVEAPLGVEPALPALLAEAGVPPEEIDVVAFTHLHFDHTGWNTVDRDGAPTPLFPNARHVVQQTEWDYWAGGATGAEPDRARGLDPITAAGLWDVADGEQALTAEVVTVPTPGHTPGHVALMVSSGGESALLIGDAAHSPVQVGEPDWCLGADVDMPLARRTRRGLWDRSVAEGLLLATNHFPFPGLGRVVEEGGVRRWARAGE